LGAEMRRYKDAGHLNSEAGYEEFSDLLSDILAPDNHTS
jgi:predicted alpha/beta hydrolase family esterase